MRAFSDLLQTPSPFEMRGLRWILSVGGFVAGSLLCSVGHKHGAALGAACAGLGLALLSLVPGLGRLIYVGWMGLGLILARITSPILLGCLWFVMFVPMSIVFRAMGRDSMKRRFPALEASYWEPRVPDKTIRNYFRQF